MGVSVVAGARVEVWVGGEVTLGVNEGALVCACVGLGDENGEPTLQPYVVNDMNKTSIATIHLDRNRSIN